MPDPPPSPHPLSYAPPPARQPRTGIISLLCGLIALLSFSLSLIAVQRPPGQLPGYTSFIGVPFQIAWVAVLVLGLITGILGIRPPHRKPALAMTGLILNGLIALFLFLLITISWLRPG